MLIRNKVSNFEGGNIWKAVRMAQNKSTLEIPANLSYKNVEVNEKDRVNVFADFFHEKIEKLTANVSIPENIPNGYNKLFVGDRFFMEESDIRECLNTLKPKMCKGYDRIPVNIIFDARELLIPTLKNLFHKIYDQCTVPDQWRISKIIPIHKKGGRNFW